jgi:hypothetical protein
MFYRMAGLVGEYRDHAVKITDRPRRLCRRDRRVARCASMNRREFWDLIEQARSQASDDDAEEVAAQAVTLLTAVPREQIVAANQALWDLMADSYRGDLWAAAYLISGGALNDGFERICGIVHAHTDHDEAVMVRPVQGVVTPRGAVLS